MTTAIIAVRVGSKRLPGKCFQEINGMPMVEQVIQRVQAAKKVNMVVLACGNYPENKVLWPIADRNGIGCFFKEDGLLIEEYTELARGSEKVVRITADCPLIDPWLIDDVVKAYDDNSELATNVLWPRTFPKGLDVEVFDIHTLERLNKEAKGEDRKHITLHIYKNPGAYRIKSVVNDVDLSKYNFSVDTADDLESVRNIYDKIQGRIIPWREMIRRVYGE